MYRAGARRLGVLLTVRALREIAAATADRPESDHDGPPDPRTVDVESVLRTTPAARAVLTRLHDELDRIGLSDRERLTIRDLLDAPIADEEAP